MLEVILLDVEVDPCGFKRRRDTIDCRSDTDTRPPLQLMHENLVRHPGPDLRSTLPSHTYGVLST